MRWLLLASLVVGCTAREAPRVAPNATPHVEELRVSHPAAYRDRFFSSLRVRFVGNANASSLELAKGMQTLEGIVDDATLAYDALVVTAWYYDHGRIGVRVSADVEVLPDALVVTMTIVEGPVYAVGTLEVFEDDGGKRAPPLGWKTPLHVGETFNRRALADALASMRTAYADLGYAWVDATPETKIDEAHHAVAIVVPVRRGLVAHFGRVQVVGTKDPAVRKEIALVEGARYSETAIVKAKQRLVESGWFLRVDVSTKKGDAEDAVDVTFEVDERPKSVLPKTALR